MVTSSVRRGGTPPDASPPRRGARSGTRIARLLGGLAGQLVGGLLGLAVAAGALVLLGTVARRGPAAPARPDDVILTLLAWVGVGLAAWLAVGSLFAVLALLPGTAGRVARQVGERITPLVVRRCLTLVLGASVGSVALPVAPVSTAGSTPVARGGGAPADAMTAASSAASGSSGTLADPAATPAFVPSVAAPAPRQPAAESTDGPGFAPSPTAPRPAPSRPPVHATTEAAGPGYVPSAPPPVLDSQRSRLLVPSPRVGSATHDLVTVRRGDTLWGLAARHLGAGASDAEVAREWPRWYAANRAVIGDDPDLLVPGQQLRPPGHTAAPPSPTVGYRAGSVERGVQR
jgi:nucleoid-associated protein YgaU